MSRTLYDEAASANGMLAMHVEDWRQAYKDERAKNDKLVERITNAALARNEPSVAPPELVFRQPSPLPDAVLDALEGLNLRGAEYADHEARARRWLDRGMDAQAVRARLVEGDVPEGL